MGSLPAAKHKCCIDKDLDAKVASDAVKIGKHGV
jgi:hypothetical protein